MAPNFCFPVRTLANDRVELVPFDAGAHADDFFAATAAHPELYAHMPMGPFRTRNDFIERFLDVSARNPEWLTLAVIDKASGELAGMMTFMDTSATHLSTEIGCIVVLPRFHRTHVTTNAVGLMLQHAFDLGLRRVQWRASSMNAASIRVAERLGFRKEGVLRWHFVMKGDGKVGNGRELPPGSKDLGRDTVVLSLCWDDWPEARDVVEKAMARVK